ncbi:MAG TPA: hypothetical protein ENI97_10355 [Gammaproteobacteria bacterium]|nr:hypothetical protein [Gammaproteobacteria bacterium]
MITDTWVDIIKSIKTPVSFLVLITLVVGYLLHDSDNPIILLGGLALLFLITITCIVYAIKHNALFPGEIRSIWSKNDLPLSTEEAQAWLGKWNCRWTYRDTNNQLKPYVDDIIEITEVDQDSGEITGIGYSSYIENENYFLRGRASNKRVAHLFYTSPAATAGLSGMVILSRPPLGDITGWWLGAGRKGGDVGGGVIMQRHEENPDFEIRNYDVD